MEIEQGGDDLEVVFHPVMDLAHQLGLADDRRFQIGLVPGHRLGHAGEGAAERRNLARRAAHSRQVDAAIAGLVGRNHALDAGERAQQQIADDDPADERGPEPHQHRRQDDQNFGERQRRRRRAHLHGDLAVAERETDGDVVGAGRKRGRAQRHDAIPLGQIDRKIARQQREGDGLHEHLAAIFHDPFDIAARIEQEEFDAIAARGDPDAADLATRRRRDRRREAGRRALRRRGAPEQGVAAMGAGQVGEPVERPLADRIGIGRLDDRVARGADGEGIARQRQGEALGMGGERRLRRERRFGAIGVDVVERGEDRENAEREQADRQDDQHLEAGGQRFPAGEGRLGGCGAQPAAAVIGSRPPSAAGTDSNPAFPADRAFRAGFLR